MKASQNTQLALLIQQCMKRAMGKTKHKELKTSIFLIALFKRFTISNKASPNATVGHNRAIIQKLLEDNTAQPSGHQHAQEFNDVGFINDFERHFVLLEK